MMKQYNTPYAILTVYATEDVITASLTNLGDSGSGYEDGKNLDDMFG